MIPDCPFCHEATFDLFDPQQGLNIKSIVRPSAKMLASMEGIEKMKLFHRCQYLSNVSRWPEGSEL